MYLVVSHSRASIVLIHRSGCIHRFSNKAPAAQRERERERRVSSLCSRKEKNEISYELVDKINFRDWAEIIENYERNTPRCSCFQFLRGAHGRQTCDCLQGNARFHLLLFLVVQYHPSCSNDDLFFSSFFSFFSIFFLVSFYKYTLVYLLVTPHFCSCWVGPTLSLFACCIAATFCCCGFVWRSCVMKMRKTKEKEKKRREEKR